MRPSDMLVLGYNILMAEDSIFTKIIKGEIPSHKIYEDDKTIAFMDIHPIQPGMVVVTTKNQIDHVWDLPTEDYQALMATVRKVAKRLREVFAEKKRVGIMIEGFDVPHAHVVVVPVNNGKELRELASDTEPDHPALAALAKKLAF